MVVGPGPCVINVVPPGLPGGPDYEWERPQRWVGPKVLTAPERWLFRSLLAEPKVFLAGGITDCPDWQDTMLDFLVQLGFQGTLFNPRRPNFNVRDASMEEEQITWEFEHLEKADVVSFWFPKETLCPITLLELGKMLGKGKRVLVGVHPQYARKSDVYYQTGLEQPDVKIVDTLPDLAEQVAALRLPPVESSYDKACRLLGV